MKNNNKNSLRERLGYWFDNRMSEGFLPKVRLLLVVSFIFVLLMGTIAAFAHGNLSGRFGEDFLRTIMYSLGKGGALTTDDTKVSIVYFIVMLITILYCMFFSAILIGLINNALRSKVEELGKGHSRVIESDHTLILGFNDAAAVLIGELIEANKNQNKQQCIVVLGKTDQNTMMEKIHKRFGNPRKHPQTRIICRTGSIYDFDDLRRCSLEASKVVIINAATDFESVKAVMACAHILDEQEEKAGPYIVSVIQNPENMLETKAANKSDEEDGRLVILSLNEVLARIMVHTSRQSGLSDVFTELFNFKDDEFYVYDNDPCFNQLYGKTISEITNLLKLSYAIGVRKKSGKIIIKAPNTVTFEEGDALIVVKEDDTPLQLNSEMHSVKVPAVYSSTRKEQINVLIIGVDSILDAVLTEYAQYLENGSHIYVVDRDSLFDSVVTERTTQLLDEKGIKYTIMPVDAGRKRVITGILRECSPDSVLQLITRESVNPEAEDERAMRTLIYLREYREKMGKQFSITSEMLRTENKDLAAATGPDDFIISRQFAALLMAQISQNIYMASLFSELLSSEGFEIYMKPASWYVPMGEQVDLITASQAAAERGEIFIGHRLKKKGQAPETDINPAKYDSASASLKQYVYDVDDCFVVLSEDSQ